MKILLDSTIFLILFITIVNGVYAQDLVASSSPTLTSTPSATSSPTTIPATPTPTTPTPTVAPTTASTATPQPTQESSSKKEVLGEKTSVLGATGSEKELTKWILALFAGVLTIVFCVKLLRSDGGQE